MSITLPLTTAAERAAALAALTTYVLKLDGATLDTAQLSHADNPETGIEVEQLVQVAPAPTHIPTAAEAFASLSPPGMVYAPIPPAPVLAPPPVSAPPAPNAEADVNGEIWSAEKHSSTKAKNKDGSWRVKRGVGSVEDAPVPPAPPAAVAAAPAAPPAPAQAGTPASFKELMDLVMPLMKAGKITSAGIAEACEMNGVANLPALNQSLGAIPNVWATIEAMAV